MIETQKRLSGITLIVFVNGFASIITIAFWVLVYFRLFGSPAKTTLDHSSIASTLGFMIADIIWAVPMLLLSVPGLWKIKFWGWTTAQFANILWLYTLTAVWIRDLYTGGLSPGSILFLPFSLFSIWAAVYLWKQRNYFFR